MPENTDGNEKYPYFVFAKLVEQLLPDERERLYAAPLTVFLEERKLGTVTGGGCQLAERAQPGEKDIDYAGLDIELANLDEALAFTKSKLTELGAPVGSEVEYTGKDGETHSDPIGDLELLNIFIDNVSLAPEIYKNADMRALCEGIESKLNADSLGELRGPCVWPSEVLLYIVGGDADDIFANIEPMRKDFPVLQNARVVFQRRDQKKAPKEIRIGFND